MGKKKEIKAAAAAAAVSAAAISGFTDYFQV